MLHKEAGTVEFSYHGAVMNLETYLIGKIVKEPYIMVAFEPCYLHSGIGQLGKSAEKAGESPGDNSPVLPPEIQDVAKKEQALRIGGYRTEECHHARLMLPGVGYVACPEMQITDEVGLVPHWVTE